MLLRHKAKNKINEMMADNKPFDIRHATGRGSRIFLKENNLTLKDLIHVLVTRVLNAKMAQMFFAA